jgi:formylglycine-generating enzyme required for sulfatase activity
MSVAIEHRLMHAETLAYMLHRMPFDMKIAPPRSALEEPVPGRFMPPTSGGDNVLVPRGPAFIGMPRSAGRFGWDNEYDGIEVDVPAFRIGRHMVTNGQFAEFVAAGGYRERRYWKDDDWTWKERALIEHPVFWQRANDSSEWRLRTMFEAIRLPRNWPVYASHAEAAAYACWAGQALPTEAQWQRAATGARDWGDAVAAKVPEKGNFDCVRWDPTPVDAAHHPESAFGAIGMFGNGWEWTSTPFAALPGFKRFEFYKGYSADFFDGRHFVMKGGSPRTAACMVRPAFRNWFQAHYQYAYAGFRCVTAIA